MTAAEGVVALIPARGGSKGIPRKNLAEVADRPLIAWSIDAALAAEHVDRVVVSTDDAEIAEVARALGAEVPFLRPAELATDDTPDLPVFEHALDQLAVSGYEPALLVHLRPTSPWRPPGLIDAAVAALRAEPAADSVRSLSPVAKTPYKMWRVVDGRLEPLVGTWDEELFNRPRQGLPEVWQHDGVVDVMWSRTIRGGSMCGRRILPWFTPEGVAVDIDAPTDLDVADRLLSSRRPRAGSGDD